MASKKQPPKPTVINPVFNDLNTKLWWEYTKYDQSMKDTIDLFFTTYSKDLPLLMTPNLYDNFQNICKLIGIYIHPLFKNQPKYSALEENQPIIGSVALESQQQPPATNQLNPPQQTNLMPIPAQNQLPSNANLQPSQTQLLQPNTEKIEPNFLIISNTMVDYATAKILNFVWSYSKLNVIKLNRNSFDDITFLQFQELIMNTNHKISKLFFEWNELRNEIALPFYTQLALSPSIEFLILRSNSITDELFIPFCEKLIDTNNQTLKFLDVYDNLLTKKSFSVLGKLLATNRSLEYLGLAKNNIENFQVIEDILSNIGKHPLTNEQYEEYQLKEKQKETILERNKKIKKKENQELIPFLDPIQLIAEGKFALLKNLKLSCLNLAKNSFDESNIDVIENLLSNSAEGFQLVVNLNKIDEKNAEKLRKKYGKKILI